MKILHTKLGKKLLSSFFFKGKKASASSLVGQAIEYLYKTQPKKREYIFFHALKKLTPSVEGLLLHKIRKQGKQNLSKPLWVTSPLRAQRRQYLKISWLLTKDKNSKGKNLGARILDSSKTISGGIQEQESFQEQARQGRPYVSFRWK